MLQPAWLSRRPTDTARSPLLSSSTAACKAGESRARKSGFVWADSDGAAWGAHGVEHTTLCFSGGAFQYFYPVLYLNHKPSEIKACRCSGYNRNSAGKQVLVSHTYLVVKIN